MAHGLNSVIKRGPNTLGCKGEGKTGIGSRRIFAPHFKLQVLDSYRNDADCKGNQRATARKYGIHRRQIQKWLQVESNLRNSVGKGKSAEIVLNPEARKCGIELTLNSGGHRQRDDSCADAYSQSAAGLDSRVPALSPAAYSETLWSDSGSPPLPPIPAPLDCRTHSRSNASLSAASPSPDSASPIDLSLKRSVTVAGGKTCTPVCVSPLMQLHSVSPSPVISSPILLSPPAQHDPDVWDLSTKSLKRAYDESSLFSHSNNTSKPIKLFKPYLDDLHDTSSSNDDYKPKTPEMVAPCYLGMLPIHESEPLYYNNNNICEIKTEYSYTLHELQPKNSNYFYPIHKGYMYQGAECVAADMGQTYEDSGFLQTASTLKQRQSYSLDFKLSAIECYYQDSACRGNQRAVANKYNIHRRQVQKWLKQEDELRQRNEINKHVHAVR